MKLYILGNCLRGSFEGEFSSIDEAWKILSARFLQSFPSDGGRSVIMKVYKKNEFDLEQFILCKTGITSLEKVSKKILEDRTGYSSAGWLI